MPGIHGFIGLPQPSDAALRLEAMAAAVRHHSWYRDDRYVDAEAGLALGRVSLGLVDQADQPARNEDGSFVGVLIGEVLDAPEHRAVLKAAGHVFRGESDAELVVHGYEQEGSAFFKRLDGSFSAAIWDGRRRRLILANDRFGMRPLYYAYRRGELLFASEIKALLTIPNVSRRLDPLGVAQFFTFGQHLGQETFLEAVSLLPAAGWLVYDVDADRLLVDRYWCLDVPADGRSARTGDHLERIDEALAASVARCTRGPGRLGISLSGGLDARTILALADHDGAPLTSVCLGIDGSLDHRCAEQMAKLAGCRHHRHVLDHAFLGDFERHLRTMVRLTDGHYLCQCIVMPTLPVYRELGVDVLLRGHAGELLHMGKAYNFSMDRATLALRDGAGIEEWLLKNLRSFVSGPQARSIFRPAFGVEVECLAQDSLSEALKESEGLDPPVHRIWHMFLSQRLRRETALSMAEFHSVVETRLPYVDAGLIQALLSAPPELKLDETIQTYILRKRRPEFLDIVNANTGARLDASPLAKKLAYYRLRALSKLKVRGYEPYERLGLWLRRELRPLISRLLLDERSLDRDLFDPAGVRAVVEDHWEGRHNYTYLILALMIFEEARRQFLEERPASAFIGKVG